MFRIKADFPTNFGNYVVRPNDARDIARAARDSIRIRTQSGIGFTGKAITRFPPLSFRTIQNRRRYSGKKGKGFNPSFSNLTQSGTLLRSISARKRKRVEAKLTISNTKATSRQRRLTNTQLVAVLRKKGFDFFDLSTFQIKALTDDYNNLVQQRLKEISD